MRRSMGRVLMVAVWLPCLQFRVCAADAGQRLGDRRRVRRRVAGRIFGNVCLGDGAPSPLGDTDGAGPGQGHRGGRQRGGQRQGGAGAAPSRFPPAGQPACAGGVALPCCCCEQEDGCAVRLCTDPPALEASLTQALAQQVAAQVNLRNFDDKDTSPEQLSNLEAQVAQAEATLRSAQNSLGSLKDYDTSDLQVAMADFAVQQAELSLSMAQTRLSVLQSKGVTDSQMVQLQAQVDQGAVEPHIAQLRLDESARSPSRRPSRWRCWRNRWRRRAPRSRSRSPTWTAPAPRARPRRATSNCSACRWSRRRCLSRMRRPATGWLSQELARRSFRLRRQRSRSSRRRVP